jgi:pentatricopeptide repeat protein
MLNLGVQLHQLMEKLFLPDIATSNALITMYSRCGELANAKAIFYQMTHKDLVSCNTLIGCYEHNGCATEALRLFEDMRSAKVMPTHTTFISLLSACGNAGLVAEGRMVFDTMVKLWLHTSDNACTLPAGSWRWSSLKARGKHGLCKII